jgi:hypothetical protein
MTEHYHLQRIEDYVGNFKAFWTQFSLLCSRFHWSNDRQIEELLLHCLRDDAFVYVNELPYHVRADINRIYRSMAHPSKTAEMDHVHLMWFVLN